MKKNLRTIIIIAFAVTFFVAVQIAQAATTIQPGSEFDPLVTKSYVDEQIQKVIQKIGTGTTSGTTTVTTPVAPVDNQVIDNIRTDIRDLIQLVIDASKRIKDLEKQNQELLTKVEQLESGFTVLELTKGQKLFAGGGSEIILRGGTANAISGQFGGLADITSGKDLNTGESLGLQHLLIASRDDGRGVVITSDQAWILIRGSYTLE